VSNTPPNIEMHLVRTEHDVADFFDWLRVQVEHNEVLSIDTESSGLKWWSYGFLRLWQIGNEDEGWAIPISWWGRVIHEAMALIVRSHLTIVFHNAKFDMHAIESSGYPLPLWQNVHDTMILLRLRRSDLPARLKGPQTAELLGRWVYFGRDALKARAKELGFKTSGADMDYWERMPVDDPAYWAYGIMDTVMTVRLFKALSHVMLQFHEQYTKKMRISSIIYQQEKRGIRFDQDYAFRLRDRLTRQIDSQLHYLQSNGLENPNSNKQIVALLEEQFGFIPWAFTDTGNPSVDKNVLKVLAEAGGLQEGVVKALIAYKRSVKWRSTYVDKFLDSLDYNGRIHPSVTPMGAVTGRDTSPFLTLPSKDPMIKRSMLADKGHKWWTIDYSNQEPREQAHYSQAPLLLKHFRTGDGRGSVHDFVAREMFGASYTEAQRSSAKVFGLSRSYGAGAETIAAASGLSLPEVEAILPAYDELVGLTTINAMINEVAKERAPNPYIVSSGGRRIYVAEHEVFKLVNYTMQSTGADVLDDGILRLDDADLTQFGIISVYDENNFQFPIDQPELAKEAAALMQDDSFTVPLIVDIDHPAPSWGGTYMTKEQLNDKTHPLAH
jgi:DNA polymerase-1